MSATKRPPHATRAQVRQFLAAAGYAGTPPDELVDAYVDLVGTAGRCGLPRRAGPTWTEVGDALGWAPALRERMIRTLAREGVLTYSPEPRSLAVAGGSGHVEG